MKSKETPIEVKRELKAIYESLNPAEIKRTIDEKLKLLADVYQLKHVQSKDRERLEKSISVRFSNYPIGRVGLGRLVT